MHRCMAIGVPIRSEFPLTRFGDHEIPEDLDLLRALELLGIDEINRHCRQLRILEHRHQLAFLSRQIVRDEPDPDARPDGRLPG